MLIRGTARNIDFILSTNLLACLSIILFVIGMFSSTTIGYFDVRGTGNRPYAAVIIV